MKDGLHIDIYRRDDGIWVACIGDDEAVGTSYQVAFYSWLVAYGKDYGVSVYPDEFTVVVPIEEAEE